MNSEQFVCVWKNRLQTVYISLENSYLKVTLLKCLLCKTEEISINVLR